MPHKPTPQELVDIAVRAEVALSLMMPCPCCGKQVAPVGKDDAWIHVEAV